MEFLNVNSSNKKLTIDLKTSISLNDNVKKENELLLKDILELKNTFTKFQKGKENLDHLLDDQRPHGLTYNFFFLMELLHHQVPLSLSSPLLLHSPFLMRVLKLKILRLTILRI